MGAQEMSLLPLDFYQNSDPIALAKALLGKWLITEIDGKQAGGIIIETEAYKGPEDRACHAYGGRRTKRTEVMFSAGGVAYVYLCYGIHNLFNIVTAAKEIPHAILVRALKPTLGIETMRERRGHKEPLTDGPGTVCAALGITRTHTGTLLSGSPIWVEERGGTPQKITESTRIGIDYAGPDALLPWRFTLE